MYRLRFWALHGLPNSAWADGNLAELALQVGNVDGTSKSKLTQPRYQTRGTPCINFRLQRMSPMKPKLSPNAIELPPSRTARMAELGISGGRCKVYSGRKFPGNLDRLREIFSDEDTFLLYPGKDSSPLEDIVVERTEEGHRLRDGIQCSR